MIVENFLELVDIDDIIISDEYVNMVDISVDEDYSFLLSDGFISHNSALGDFRKYRDPNTQAAYTLRGKFLNTNSITNKKIMENEEASGLLSSLGLSLLNTDISNIRYGKIIIATDMDCLEENTLIITKDGAKKIKDITYEDLILTHTGEYKKVKNIIQKDVNNYIKIKVNGNTIVCSENHKLMIFRDGNIMEMEAKYIKYTDYFLIKK